MSCLIAITIHTFGDSHSQWSKKMLSLVDSNPPVNLAVHHLGPKLMNTFADKKNNFLDISKYGVIERDIVVFSFGEIDARCHLHRHTTERGIKNEIFRLTDQYFEAINLNIQKYKNLSVWIQGLVPPTDAFYDRNFPRTGTFNERLLFYTMINFRLITLSQKYNFKYLDFFSEYANDQGGSIPSLSDGTVHISVYLDESKQMIADLIKEHLNKNN